MWLPWKRGGDEEAGLKLGRLKPGQGRGPRRLVPWWVGALRRAKAASVMHRQPKTSAGGGGLRRRVAPARMYGRRSVVKASFRRNRGKGAWVRHARYLARERAQHEHDRGRGFDARSEGLDMAATVREWERADEVMWSFIVSPEDAARMNLRGHTRDMVAAVERDLGTGLEWIAIDHHNTDDAHVHLLIRGVREDGKVLVLDRDYVSRGIREISRELAERELGPRDEREYLRTRGRSIEREYWTEIDRALERKADPDRTVSYRHFQPYTDGAQVKAQQEMERLAYLQKLGLARAIDDRTWWLAPEHESELRKRQRDRDIIKTRARERMQQHSKEREIER
jgi:type IV secretory pathway VirD2 relaxase